jgi:hypothetical protein
MDLSHLAQDWNKWKALVNVIMNLQVHKMWEISLVHGEMLASQQGLCCMELVSSDR